MLIQAKESSVQSWHVPHHIDAFLALLRVPFPSQIASSQIPTAYEHPLQIPYCVLDSQYLHTSSHQS